jgi:hypothetical protein
VGLGGDNDYNNRNNINADRQLNNNGRARGIVRSPGHPAAQ